MSNDNKVDYEKQFQADMEKAKALSLEELYLEKYRMEKLHRNQTVSSRKSPDTTKPPVAESGMYIT